MIGMPQLIGLTGRASAGKDTLAQLLHSRYDYVRYAYADPLRTLLNERFGWKPAQWEDREWKEYALADEAGGYSPRSWMQWLGTEVLRTYAGYDIFVRLAFTNWDKHPYPMVISDVRFSNEAQAIINRGGMILEVTREGTGALNDHVSERTLHEDLFHGTVSNNGTREQLLHVATHLLKAMWDERNRQLELPLECTVHDLFDRHGRGES